MIRKIMTAEEIHDKDVKNKRILALIIGLVMLFSTASYAFFSFDGSSNSENSIVEKIEIAGIDFIKDSYGFWNFNISDMSFQTGYNPQETLNVSVKINKTLPDFYNKMLYFGINSLGDSVPEANNEISKNIGKYTSNVQYSCLLENCTEDYPIKDCKENNVVIFKKAEVSSIDFDNDNCILILYAKGDEVRAADSFLYSILGFKTK